MTPLSELGDLRLYKRKRIIIGDSDEYVDIPVLYEAHLKTMAEQAQEYVFYIDNSEQSSRTFHVRRIANQSDSSRYVDCERIEQWFIKNMAEQAQEYAFVLANNDPPPLTIREDGTADTSVMHEQVHYVRYFFDNDAESDTYIDLELIDQIKIKDATSQAQEWIYYLRHPSLGEIIDDPSVPYIVTAGYCDPSLELVAG